MKVIKPPRTWNFTKYIPNFDHKHINVGDVIKTPYSDNKILYINISSHVFYYYDKDNHVLDNYYLKELNRQNKNKNESKNSST